MRDKIFAIAYAIIGIGVIGLWIMLLATSQVPELETAPVEIVFHILIELAMAWMALVAAYVFWAQQDKRIVLFANGMLAYSVINSSGYYGQSGDYAMIGMFAVILGFVIYVSYVLLVKQKEVV